jgi:protocatechuate 3,4-dioxygenase beta subunit
MSEADQPRVLTRRQALAAGAAGAAGLILSPALGVLGLDAPPALASAIALTPEQEEGPFYVAIEKVRRNIASGQAGVPLLLSVAVLDSTTGEPIQGAAVDVWQCNALGVYSDEASEQTLGKTYLRGVQLTDANGRVRFATIYPGHYAGRTTHIHAKVHIAGAVSDGAYAGGHVSHTGQILFSDAISTEVYRLDPYTSDKAKRVLNAADRVYTQQGGAQSVLKLARRSGSLAKAGFSASIALAVDPTATPAAVGVSSAGAAPGTTGAPPQG